MIKRIQNNSIEDCLKMLPIILFSFFYTELIMHKQGVIYRNDQYKQKTIYRLKNHFDQVRKIFANDNYAEILGFLKKQEEFLNRKRRASMGYRMNYMLRSVETSMYIHLCIQNHNHCVYLINVIEKKKKI